MSDGEPVGDPRPVLVAGLGNVFFGDDGFGPGVLERLLAEPLPPGVDAVDFGIASLHLAYRLAEDRYGTVIFVDAISTGEPPGTVSLIEVEDAEGAPGALDGHSVSPASVLAAAAALGARAVRTVLVGCEPASFVDGMVLSPVVAAAVEPAAALVRAEAAAARNAAPARAVTGGGG